MKFPYNHLKIINFDKLKKYVPPMKPENGLVTVEYIDSLFSSIACSGLIDSGTDAKTYRNLFVIFEYAKRYVRLGEQFGLQIDLPDLEEGQCCWRDHNKDGNCHIHSSPGFLRIDNK